VVALSAEEAKVWASEAREDRKAFAEFVWRRRRALGLSVADVASRLGIAPVSLYKIEGASRAFTEDAEEGRTYEKYAEILECSPGQLKKLQPTGAPLMGSIHQARANKLLADELRFRIDSLEKEDQEHRQELLVIQQLTRSDLIEPFTDMASRIEGLGEGLAQSGPTVLPDGVQVFSPDDLGQWNVVAQALGQLAATSAGGAAAGALAAFTAYAGVAALGVASTGTSIATLSGAAATSATLAALGGGSLAAGGWGVVGGTALLAGVVTVPAAIGLGVGALFADRYAFRKLYEQGADIEHAADDLNRLEKQLRLRWEWATTQGEILNTLRHASALPLARLTRRSDLKPNQPPVLWVRLGSDQERVTFLASTVTASIEAMSLPTWTPATGDSGALDNPDEVNARYSQLVEVSENLLAATPD